MAQNDYAIVVGINRYASFDSLDGPENDACDFRDWLIDNRGGNVPKNNVKLVLSRDFQPHDPLPHRARPALVQVTDLLDDWYARGDEMGFVGDRLYLYLAGHGFSRDIDSAALLMANAARGAVGGRHIPGRPYANWFRQAGFAREVVLFMDCCRESFQMTTIGAVPWEPRNGAAPARKFFGFATKWGRAARESQTVAGAVRGAFTLALTEGLRGKATTDANGQVRGADLEAYVFGRLGANSDDDEEPEFEYSKQADLLFNPAPGEPPSNPVVAGFAAAAAPPPATAPPGADFRIRLASNGGPPPQLVDGALTQIPLEDPAGNRWTWRVPNRGLYSLKFVDGTKKFVEVVGDREDVDVSP
jgi:uncharacterized caspase-like protein